MKNLGFLLIVSVFFTACLKDTTTPQAERLYDYLTFTFVNGPDTASVTDTISFNIRVGGNKSCYRLEGYEGVSSGDRQYDIRAVGSYPNPVLGDTLNCNGVYIKDTTVKFMPRNAGKQVFRFYNGTTLFRADTVVVN